MGRAAQPDDDVPEGPVVHVQAARPGDRPRFDVERVVVVDGGVQGRGQQVVRGRDGVEVSREVEVDVLHGEHLGVPTTRPSTLDPEHRPGRWLAHAEDRPPADASQPLGETDRCRRLPFARSGGGDGRDDDDPPVRAVAKTGEDRRRSHLGLEPSI